MGCQRDCFNCGSTDNVVWSEQDKEFFCEDCKFIKNFKLASQLVLLEDEELLKELGKKQRAFYGF